MAANNDSAKCGGTCDEREDFREGFTGNGDPCDRCSLEAE